MKIIIETRIVNGLHDYRIIVHGDCVEGWSNTGFITMEHMKLSILKALITIMD